MNLYSKWFVLNYKINDMLIGLLMILFLIVLIILGIKDKKKQDYNINLAFICLGNIVILFFLTTLGDIFCWIPLISTSVFLKYFYNRAIDEINEYEIKGISYKNEKRKELSAEFDATHSKETIDKIKIMAKNSKKYRMGTIKYFFSVYSIPVICFGIQMII